MDFSKELIFTAYKKLKHYYYFDNTTLFTRKRIAQFEHQHLRDLDTDAIKFKLKDLVDLAFAEIQFGVTDIKPYILPKIIQKSSSDAITNHKGDPQPLKVQRFSVLADTSVEIHIICTLWVMEVGRFLENTISQNNFAYKVNLDINEDTDVPWENLKLFQPYFVQYQKWRDGAIEKAEALMDEKRNVSMLSLDIKDYFHSVRLDFSQLNNDVNLEIEKKYQFKENGQERIQYHRSASGYLNKILFEIHKAYASKLESYDLFGEIENDRYPLPIGLISSGILGNYHLNEFDAKVIDKLNPAYYGRYVDDLMFVFSDLKISSNDHTSAINTFINRYFVKRQLLIFDIQPCQERFFDNGIYIEKEADLPLLEIPDCVNRQLINKLQAKEIRFKIATDERLKIQSSKINFHYFDYRESRATLNIFKAKLEKQRSEFRFLPDEDKISKEFDQEAFSLQYNDSINKFRSIQDFSEDKYGASKFLAKKLFARNLGPNEEDDEVTDRQILTFFKGFVGINFYSLWEKVATYFVISNRGDNLIRFIRNIRLGIANIEVLSGTEIDVDLSEQIKIDLFEFLKISVAIPLSLYPEMELEFINKKEDETFQDINLNYVTPIRSSNLFRQSLVNLPFLNYTSYLNTTGSLLIHDFPEAGLVEELNLGILAPNYISFHEVNIFQIAKVISRLTKEELEADKETGIGDEPLLDKVNGIPDAAFDLYFDFNYKWKKEIKSKEKLKGLYFRIAREKDGGYINVDIYGERDKEHDLEKINKKVAIANIKVEQENIRKSIRKLPNVKKARRKEVFKLLNQADEEGADLIVFPEVSIPYSWLRLLAERSHKRYMGIVAGLEHWINNSDFAFNFMVTVLPFKVHNYKTSLIKIRLKNHYSHKEKEQLRGNRLLIPGETVKGYPKLYDLFHWRRTYFSVYNCFELADISHRAIFRSKVDFLIASEYNVDTSYFSDVAGAWVRDVHCFFIQVNSSDFGDSRLIQPSKSYSKDMIQVKGGINSTVLVGELQIEKLREFQYVEYNLQREMIDSGRIDIKPTPPDFDPLEVKKRILNKNLIK